MPWRAEPACSRWPTASSAQRNSRPPTALWTTPASSPCFTTTSCTGTRTATAWATGSTPSIRARTPAPRLWWASPKAPSTSAPWRPRSTAASGWPDRTPQHPKPVGVRSPLPAARPRRPFLGEQGVEVGVAPGALDLLVLAQGPLPAQAQLLEDRRRAGVAHVAGRPHPMQSQGVESDLDQREGRLVAIALAPMGAAVAVAEI